MKAFDIMRYLRRFSILIIIFALAGAFFIYYYGKNHQKYEAVTTIVYKNSAASRGYTPNGELLDPDEVFSAAVVTDAVSQLNLDEGNGIIRANGYMEPVVPEEEQTRIDALLSDGQESEYFPTTYIVHFIADHTHSAAYARNVLTAVMQSYFEYYSEKYTDQKLIDNNVAVLKEKNYEYLDKITIIEDSVADIMGYLDTKLTKYPDYRSITTGCCYRDLHGIYKHIYENEIPKLYSMILNSGSAIDPTLLITAKQAKINRLQVEIEEMETQIKELDVLMDGLVSKSNDIMEYHYSYGESKSNGTDYILGDVYGSRGEEDVQKQTTTYDTMILKYVDLLRDCEHKKIELAYQQEILALFTSTDTQTPQTDTQTTQEALPADAASASTENGTTENGTTETVQPEALPEAEKPTSFSKKTIKPETIEKEINQYVDILNEYFELVENTTTDLNAKLGAENLEVVSSVRVSEAINIKLYIVLALMFFLVLGVFLAVVAGRSFEFLEYLIYIDKKVELPNRLRCDQFIEKRVGQLLPENYTCIFLTFDNLAELSREVNREFGDSVLHDFGLILKGFYREGSFVGYNEGGKFICFFENLNGGQARSILRVLKEQVDDHNALEPARNIQYSVGVACSTERSIYEIRSLMVAAMNSVKKA